MKTIIFLALFLGIAFSWRDITGRWMVTYGCQAGLFLKDQCPRSSTLDKKYKFQCPYQDLVITREGSGYSIRMGTVNGGTSGNHAVIPFQESDWMINSKGQEQLMIPLDEGYFLFIRPCDNNRKGTFECYVNKGVFFRDRRTMIIGKMRFGSRFGYCTSGLIAGH